MPRTRALSPEKVADLFWSRVEKDLDGCWIYIGGGPYSVVVLSDLRNIGGHRYSYEQHRGPIPEGLVLDHLCRNTKCVNPDHLEAVTQRENIRRGTSKVAQQMRQTHCKRGHEFTPENTRLDCRGGRCCRACDRERKARVLGSDAHTEQKGAGQ